MGSSSLHNQVVRAKEESHFVSIAGVHKDPEWAYVRPDQRTLGSYDEVRFALSAEVNSRCRKPGLRRGWSSYVLASKSSADFLILSQKREDFRRNCHRLLHALVFCAEVCLLLLLWPMLAHCVGTNNSKEDRSRCNGT